MSSSKYEEPLLYGTFPEDFAWGVATASYQYYKNLISALKAQGVAPTVTLYHWDLPQALQDRGGWLNSDIALWFEEYARVCFKEFGDEVKMWITLNEPWVTSVCGHGNGEHAPGLKSIGESVYVAAHNQIRAHAKAYRLYHNHFASHQNGEVGITLNIDWAEPVDGDIADHLAASDRAIQFHLGWFAHPIFIDGAYPAIMREKIDSKSKQQGFKESRLPTFTAEELVEVSGSSDFLGINFYTSRMVAPQPGNIKIVSYFEDKDVLVEPDPNWYKGGSSWLYVTPIGIRKMMNWIKKEYGADVPIFITENGLSDRIGNLDDMHREYYYKHYINQLLKASLIDGVKLRGYFAWSLMDNFEWARGYLEKFGVHNVDMDDPDRKRTPKRTATFLKKIFTDNGFIQD